MSVTSATSAVGEPIHTFGVRRLDKVYKRRPGAYGVAFDGPDQVLAVRTHRGLFLPGGGVDFGETHDMALLREFAEETGREVAWHGHLATVRQYATNKGGGSLEKICAYFLVRLEGAASGQLEAGHEPVWLDLDGAGALTLESDRWAVRLAAQVVAQATGA